MSTIKVDAITTRTGSGNLTLDTNTLVVDSTNNRVGIGTTAPGRKLELNNGGTGAFVTFTDGVATNFTFKTDGNQVGTFGTEAGSTHLGLMASGTERVRIHSGGVMSVNNGIELGSGLDATAANVLDDYEEGTFTPNIGGSGVAYGTQAGVYRKIGSLVYVYLQISINTIGSPATTSGILGLPFAPTISNQYMGITYATGLNSNYYSLWGNFRSNSEIRTDAKQSNGSGQNSGISWAKTGAAIYGSGCYYTNA